MQPIKDISRHRRIAGALAASLVTLNIVAQGVAAAHSPSGNVRPTLVVGITVEGLGDEYLDLLRDYFTRGGFNRLRDNGVVISDLTYGPNVDATAATAMIMTGAPASVSGIPSATIYDVTGRRSVDVMSDASTLGNFTSETLSPKALKVTGLADEIRLSEGGINAVYAIASDAQRAILMASHTGSSAFWINDTNGNWSTSTHYKDVPSSLSNRNFTRSLASRLDTLRWQPTMAADRYPGIPKYIKAYPFKHVFLRNDVNRYRAFKASAPANREVTDVAADFITSMGLGKRDMVDMISLGYSVAPYPYSKDSDSRLETMDAYLRLDSDLQRLFEVIDRSGPGMDHTLVFVAGVPAPATGKRPDERFGLPFGVFSPRKAISLLNVYLMAIHGNGEWVAGWHNNQVHLNAALAKERGVEMTQLRREAADFLVRMAGVCRAFTIDDILSGTAGHDSDALKRNTDPDHCGDIFVTIAPGWEIETTESRASATSRPMVSRLGSPTYPAFIMAPGVDSKTITGETDACVLAPTVARLLRIRSPNGAEAAPLRLR